MQHENIQINIESDSDTQIEEQQIEELQQTKTKSILEPLKIRLHMLAIPHTISNNTFSHCAFTGKVLRFCEMMTSLDNFEVYHYGIETSDVKATKHIDVMTKLEWEQLRIESFQFLHPDMNITNIKEHLNNDQNFIGDLGNYGTPLYKKFNHLLKPILQKNYRSTATDIICLPFGCSHDDALSDLNVVAVESGIGYPDSYRDYRIFESYSYKHYTLGKQNKPHPSNYWFVVPNYYNILEWPFSNYPSKPKIGYFGRLCDIKGLYIIVEISRRFPHIEFVICGQGNDYQKYLQESSNITYQSPLQGEDRALYLNSLTALITPSIYLEPFCGVNVEAQICGVPVIAQDHGAFVETIEPFKTGLLCHTLADFCYGVQMALAQKFERSYIRQRAIAKYDMFNVALQYEYAFKNILDIHNGQNGWYSQNSYINSMKSIEYH